MKGLFGRRESDKSGTTICTRPCKSRKYELQTTPMNYFSKYFFRVLMLLIYRDLDFPLYLLQMRRESTPVGYT